MPARLPESVKHLTIQQWLQGKSRNNIAADNGISVGAVTNILNEWRRDLGNSTAEELRQLVAKKILRTLF
jgi:DNA-directed RNA polymerase specialized sigma24 family protein